MSLDKWLSAAFISTLMAGMTPSSAAPSAAAGGEPVVHSHFAEVDGVKVFYREAGSPTAPTIVLLHGFPSSSHMYRDLIPRLAGRFHVIAPDYPGFGYSDMPKPSDYGYTFANLSKTMDGLLEQLKAKSYVLYMQDYGGPVGLQIATAHPERVRGLVVQNANMYMDGVSETVAKVFIPLWKEQNDETIGVARNFLKAETTKFQYVAGAKNAAALNPDAWTLDQALLDRPGNDTIQLALLVDYRSNVAKYEEWQRYLRTQQPKTLVVWGKGDPFFTVAGAEAFRRDLKQVEVHYFDAGHFALEEEIGRAHV